MLIFVAVGVQVGVICVRTQKKFYMYEYAVQYGSRPLSFPITGKEMLYEGFSAVDLPRCA